MDSDRFAGGAYGMDSNSIIISMLAFCGIVTVIIIFSEPLKRLMKLVLNSSAGVAAMFVINTVFGSAGFNVGINPFTVLTAGLLGLPGIAALYIAYIILA